MKAGIAAGHPATAAAGASVLAAGGNAADAAVAATLAASVAETIMTGVGGGGFATYYDADRQEVTCLDFFCAVPGLDRDCRPGPMTRVEIYFGEVPIDYQIGGPTVAVPGVPAGCGELHQRWGQRPWADLVRPAVELAATGTALPAMHARALTSVWPALAVGPGAAIYEPGGELLRAGDTLFHPGLAGALEVIAADGPQACYTGEIGAATVAAVRADGGALGPRDLAEYRVRELPVVTATLGGKRICGRRDLLDTIGTIAALPAGPLARPDRAVAVAAVLSNHVASPLGETTNIAIRDRHGNCCVVTVSLGLGSATWLDGYGIHLNSMLGEGELRTAGSRPGDRVASMMCPLVVIDPTTGHPVLAAGSAGASRIRSALLYTLLGVLIDGLPVPAAIAAPRAHVVDGIVHAEPGFPDEELTRLADAGWKVNRWADSSHYFGGVSAIGDAGAAGDPRRDGVAIIVD
jgi:gamma-glutamyltranspeptidase/glutathione hydrolase